MPYLRHAPLVIVVVSGRISLRLSSGNDLALRVVIVDCDNLLRCIIGSFISEPDWMLDYGLRSNPISACDVSMIMGCTQDFGVGTAFQEDGFLAQQVVSRLR